MKLSPEDKEVRTAYRNLFSTSHGQKVLAHMLVKLNWFSTAPTEEAIVLQNFAKWLLKTIGVFEPDNVESIVRLFFQIPLKD